MALTELFNDRKARKFIRESINEAAEIGKGYCSFCGHSERLLQAFEGVQLCENCATRLLEKADNYDRVFDEVPSSDDVLDMLSEAYVYLNTAKLEADAVSNFGGSVPNLIRSYGIKLKPGKGGWNDQYHKGMIWIDSSDIKNAGSPGLRLNHFLSDYSAMSAKSKTPFTCNPDSDGFSYQVIDAPTSFQSKAEQGVRNSQFTQTAGYIEGKGAGAISPKANTKQVPASPASTATPVSAPASKPASPAKPTKVAKGGFVCLGDNAAWNFQIGKSNLYFSMSLVSAVNDVYTYEVRLEKGNSILSQGTAVVNLKGGPEADYEKAASQVVDTVIKAPGTFIPSFAGEKDSFAINKYGTYEFAFDAHSFYSGKDITMATVFNNTVVSSKRVTVSDKVLTSRVALNAELTEYMDKVIADKYPVLFSKDSLIQTSIGKVNFTFQGFDSNKKPIISILVGKQVAFSCTVSKEEGLADTSKARETLMNLMYQALKMIIPNFFDSPYRQKDEDKFILPVNDCGQAGAEVWADFDLDAFMDRGDIAFKVSVYDKHTGQERPQAQETYIYRQAKISIEDYLNKIGHTLYKECFGKSTMSDSMTKSAREKMKNPGKKQALFDKIANIFVKKFPEIKALKSCEVEVDMNVNRDGKVVDASITVRDPYEDVSSTSRDLASQLKMEKVIKFLKFFKAHPEGKDGPAVTYKVDNIEAFAIAIDLSVLEHLIFEAFGITYINENGRKVISI